MSGVSCCFSLRFQISVSVFVGLLVFLVRGAVLVCCVLGLLVVNVCFRLVVKRVLHRVWCFLVSSFRMFCKYFGVFFGCVWCCFRVCCVLGLLVVNVCFRLVVKFVFHFLWCFLVLCFRLL